MAQDDNDFFTNPRVKHTHPDLDQLLGTTVRLERDEEPRIVVGILQYDDDLLSYVIVDETGNEQASFSLADIASIRDGDIYMERSEIIQEAINRAEEHGWDHPLL